MCCIDKPQNALPVVLAFTSPPGVHCSSLKKAIVLVTVHIRKITSSLISLLLIVRNVKMISLSYIEGRQAIHIHCTDQIGQIH